MRWSLVAVVVGSGSWAVSLAESPSTASTRSGCAACHEGIEAIRDYESKMMQQIIGVGRGLGDPDGCVVCHGGDAKATEKAKAHTPGQFYPDPGSPWVNERTCGDCHGDHVGTQWNSLMMTESGKIQGVAWSFGSLEGYNHGWGNYDAKNPANPAARQGTEAYRAYMERLKQLEPGAYPDEQKTVPAAPVDVSKLKDHPEQAAFTYIRTECERCHLGVKGRGKRGDYRGMGCSACHIPYSNEGFYEGKGKNIPRDERGHMLVHSMQATREAKVTVHDKTYSGIPVKTCTTCHDRGKRIGVSFQGLMESAFTSPYREGGQGQVDLHTKHYLALHQDIHGQKGMVCHDCHTSICVHGDGFLCGTNLAQVQIECSDCHGTPWAYPWELPLGAMDEFGESVEGQPARGVGDSVLAREKQGTVFPARDGYLLTARGNPMPEVVRDGSTVVVHSAGGKDLVLKPLKLMVESSAIGEAGRVAMEQVGLHVRKMECYSCHAKWAPQCYGCHVKVDYSGDRKAFDWVAAGHMHQKSAHRADRGEAAYQTFVAGQVEEQRSYMRWEDPALAVNGEGRISPAAPGCQPSVTIIGAGGETILLNHIFRTKPNSEGAGQEGQLAIDFSPGQPHTMDRAARSCESCHLSAKAMGYGIGGGEINRAWDKPTMVELMTPGGEVLAKAARVQIEPIEGLSADWSRFVTEDGKQLMTVGHHWSRSRPMNNEERNNMDRQRLCLACHQEIPTQSLAVSVLHHIAAASGQIPRSAEAHHSLVHKTLLFAAWGQVGMGFGGPGV
ncbi:MAG: cytochrome c3 family protein, partial [Phycisphaerae bacterium]|nr:cytochrome c3 family protein [Phycisphaerae bacterium]